MTCVVACFEACFEACVLTSVVTSVVTSVAQLVGVDMVDTVGLAQMRGGGHGGGQGVIIAEGGVGHDEDR